MKKLADCPASLLLILSLVGCANNEDTNNTNGNACERPTIGLSENTGAGESANGTNDVNNNRNTLNNDLNKTGNVEWKVEVADDVAERISAMDEVTTHTFL